MRVIITAHVIIIIIQIYIYIYTQRQAPTWKKVMVEPPCMVPYSMAVWSARSSTDSMGTSILCTVRKAARLAVYEEMMIRVKAHLRSGRETLGSPLVDGLGGVAPNCVYTTALLNA